MNNQHFTDDVIEDFYDAVLRVDNLLVRLRKAVRELANEPTRASYDALARLETELKAIRTLDT